MGFWVVRVDVDVDVDVIFSPVFLVNSVEVVMCY